MRLVSHLRSVWGPWWFTPIIPLLFLPLFAVTIGLRVEHLVVVAILTALTFAGQRGRDLLIAVSPGLAVALGNEVVRFLRPIFVTPERVLGCNLRQVELSLFGLNGGTLADFFAEHHSAGADVFFAIPYAAFWMVAVATAIYYFFKNRPVMDHYLWVLALTNAVSFTLWLALPAAPPWYIRLHGCGIDINALPSAAGLLRVDQLLHTSYFESFYSRAPTVFGALPSLHSAYPAAGLVAVWGRAGWPVRLASICYLLWMLAASVYLDHHWLIDGLVGIGIVFLAHFVVRRWFGRATAISSPAS